MRDEIELLNSFVDIHCHLIPGIDDGADTWPQSLEMARIALADGIGTIIATPHQLGNYSDNSGETIRQRVTELQQRLDDEHLSVRILPGADVRIEPNLVEEIQRGNVLTLADHGKHVLLELPHEIYFPMEPVLDQLRRAGIRGILSHPERNRALLEQPQLVPALVDYGCLMQITADSLLGQFGSSARRMSEALLHKGCVHFVASDAHGVKARKPRLHAAFQRVTELVGVESATRLCHTNPQAVVDGLPVESTPLKRPKQGIRRILPWLRSA
jgi:protein-tyrosine phosphatase